MMMMMMMMMTIIIIIIIITTTTTTTIIRFTMRYDRMCAQLHFVLCNEIGVKLERWSFSESVVAVFSKERPERITRSEEGLYPNQGSRQFCTTTAAPCRPPSFTDTFHYKTL
jgi:hypothetical protein